MPCMCWYDPSDEDKKYIKDRCVELVEKIKYLQSQGDPLGCELEDIKSLLDHLYTGKCKEKEESNA